MYTPYIYLSKKVFPNAKIVIDKFHIVQLLTSDLYKLIINEMKVLDTKSVEYKRLKHYWNIVLAKKW
ncbi:transposase [Peptostreptococcus anaerobius]|uniref:transposase n=1 Tax=Peptostreptococcus TaxID=1257 RepID=UPI0009B69CB8|nr:transposase [Peptostreptococcus anaerobius]